MTWDVNMDAGFAALKEGRFAAAEPAFSAAVEEAEDFGPLSQMMEVSLDALARSQQAQEAHGRAEPVLRRLLEVRLKTLDVMDPKVLATLINLGWACRMQKKYAEAESHYRIALGIAEATLPADDADLGMILNNLAAVLGDEKLAEADALFSRAIQVWETALGPNHQMVGSGLRGLAGVHMKQNRNEEAKVEFYRSLAIEENSLGPEHPDLAHSLNNLSGVLMTLGEQDEAVRVLQRAIAIREKALGPNHVLVALSLCNLAAFIDTEGRIAEVEQLLLRALPIFENGLGSDVVQLQIDALDQYASMLRKDKRPSEAEKIEARANAIRAKGPNR